MKSHSNYLIMTNLIVLLVVSLFSIAVAFGEQQPSVVEIPIPPRAYDIRYHYNDQKNVKFMAYKVNIIRPAKEIRIFYESNFKEKGWKRSGEYKNQWESFVDLTLEGTTEIEQLFITWICKKLHAKAILALKYFSTENILHVSCQVQPLINEERKNLFLKQLESTGEFSDFMKLLDVYRINDGKVDIDRAINENKQNNPLKRYKRIMELEKIDIQKSKLLYR